MQQSSSSATPKKLTVRDVIGTVNRISSKWKDSPAIHVVQSVSDLMMPAVSDAAGIYCRGTVFLVADNLYSLDHAELVLLHEVVGHYGLAKLFGDKLDGAMLKIYEENESVRSRANAWMAVNNSDNKALAAEEALSDLAAEVDQVKGWERLTGAFRKGIRAIGFKLPVNDLDVRVLLGESRRAIEKPVTVTTVKSLAAKYSRLSQTISAEFKSWFGKSKVADDQGKPLMVYQGTGADFSVFNASGGNGKTFGTGAFFTSNTANANTYTGGINGGNVIPVYLKLENPAIFDCLGRGWDRLGKRTKVDLPSIRVSAQEDEDLLAALMDTEPKKNAMKTLKARKTTLSRLFKDEMKYDDDFASTDDLARWARKQGYDGVIFQNVRDNGPSGVFATDEAKQPCTVYVVFAPENIKSAIGNNGSFDPGNPDIRYSRNVQRDLRIEAFNRWFEGSKVVDAEGNPLVVFHGTQSEFEDFLPGAYFSESTEEAGAYTGARATMARARMTGKYKVASGADASDGAVVRYAFDGLSELESPQVGEVVGTDDLAYRYEGMGKWVVFDDLEPDFDADVSDEDHVVLRRADNAAAAAQKVADYEELVINSTPGGEGGGHIRPVYLSIKNPVRLGALAGNQLSAKAGNDRAFIAEQIAKWEAQGYDGIVTESDEATIIPESREGLGGIPQQWVAFRPEQVKNAIGNIGDFDFNEADIRYKRTGLDDAFKTWFNGSKVVDENGAPLVVYRGGPTEDWETGAEITEFRSKNGPWAGFFTDSRDVASGFAEAHHAFTRGNGVPAAVFPVYLSMQRPLEHDAQGKPAREFQIDASVLGKKDHPLREQMLNGDYDGLILRNTADEGDVFVPLKPEQIKSAIGNCGEYSIDTSDLRYSRKYQAPASKKGRFSDEPSL
ncbi:ADP-ribosyltransferase-containing protein [Pseudomonas aeruginosa]